jgi:hypothetical protein
MYLQCDCSCAVPSAAILGSHEMCQHELAFIMMAYKCLEGTVKGVGSIGRNESICHSVPYVHDVLCQGSHTLV